MYQAGFFTTHLIKVTNLLNRRAENSIISRSCRENCRLLKVLVNAVGCSEVCLAYWLSNCVTKAPRIEKILKAMISTKKKILNNITTSIKSRDRYGDQSSFFFSFFLRDWIQKRRRLQRFSKEIVDFASLLFFLVRYLMLTWMYSTYGICRYFFPGTGAR